MQTLVDLIKAIAWPVAAVWLGYLFRGEIRNLMARVSQLKYKDVEAKFDKMLSKVEAEVAVVPSHEKGEATKSETLSQLDQLRRIADVSPRAAIMEAWILLETAAMEGTPTPSAYASQMAMRSAINNRIRSTNLSPNTILIIENLRQLRNQAVHMPDFIITTNEAERYLEVAVKTAELFRSSQPVA